MLKYEYPSSGKVMSGDYLKFGMRWEKANGCIGYEIKVGEGISPGMVRRPLKSADRRKTVRAKRPLQQRKVAIWPCESDKPCEDRGPENNCNFHGSCSAKGHTASFA
ncbi:MAG: hypothetical protein PHS93_09935 [Candidatus Omnitrophica bacterium]|nr:hypothetical protein [Candidatus Omnitrophota bacterium]MDD5353469.1 hypothetical protein [Candidatus Omnitrophota bacterium]